MYKVILSFLAILIISYFVYNIEKTDDQINIANSYPNASTTMIFYKSLSTYDFVNITSGNGTYVYGHLIIPDICTVENKCPLMVFSHGSAAWRPHHERYINRFISEGIATFKLFPFGSRGVLNTIGNQTQVTQQMIISDAYGIIPILETYNNIDVENLGIMGTSLGGGAALFAAWNPPLLKSIYGVNREFKLHIALYPPCFVYPNTNIWSNHTVAIMIGTADEWTRPEPCVEIMRMMYNGTGYNKVNKKLYLYKDEHHSFDDIYYKSELKGTYDFINCRFYMDEDGRTLYNHDNTTVHVGDISNRGFALSRCAIKKDHHVGYNSKLINNVAMENLMLEVFSALKPDRLYN